MLEKKGPYLLHCTCNLHNLSQISALPAASPFILRLEANLNLKPVPSEYLLCGIPSALLELTAKIIDQMYS